MGHEFSHILNGDMALNLRLAALLAGLTWLKARQGRGAVFRLGPLSGRRATRAVRQLSPPSRRGGGVHRLSGHAGRKRNPGRRLAPARASCRRCQRAVHTQRRRDRGRPRLGSSSPCTRGPRCLPRTRRALPTCSFAPVVGKLVRLRHPPADRRAHPPGASPLPARGLSRPAPRPPGRSRGARRRGKRRQERAHGAGRGRGERGSADPRPRRLQQAAARKPAAAAAPGVAQRPGSRTGALCLGRIFRSGGRPRRRRPGACSAVCVNACRARAAGGEGPAATAARSVPDRIRVAGGARRARDAARIRPADSSAAAPARGRWRAYRNALPPGRGDCG